MNQSENMLRFFCRALAAVISRMRRNAKIHLLIKSKTRETGVIYCDLSPKL